MNISKKKITKVKIGWQEWCAFPELNLPAVKAKIDTGAKTSSLHADHLQVFQKDGEDYIRFTVHPVQKDRKIIRICEAKIKDYRNVTSSNGEREKRYVIETQFNVGDISFKSDITLTTRYGMAYRMLFGKEALKTGKFVVDVAKSFSHGKIKNAEDLYI